MNEFNIAIGRRIRSLRESKGYTRERLAELAEINDKFLYEVETGKKGLSAHKMFKLSLSLNVTMDYLVSGERNNEKYMIITSLLSNLNDIEVEKMGEVISKIIALLKYNSDK